MNKIIKRLFPCFVVACSLSSCYDTMDDKDTIDALYEETSSITVAMNQASAIDYSSLSASGSVGSTDGVLEVGFMISTDADFSNPSVIPCDELSANFSQAIGDLRDNTTYYVRSYAVTKASGTVISESMSVTTPKAPEFEDTYLFGTYTATDFDINTNEPDGDSYEVTIAQKDGMWNQIVISNIWGGGLDIEATVDFENKTITTKENSVIYVHPDYDNVWAWGLSVQEGKLAMNSKCIVSFTYDDSGTLYFGYWAARCEAGTFGYYMTELVKQ